MNARKNPTAPPVTIERGRDHEVIHPKNLLKRRAVVANDGPFGIDETAIRRAEQALKALAPQFNGWMEEAARKLADRWADVHGKGYGEGRLSALHRDAHDIRGQATTLGFPLCARVGASLCLILEALPPERLAEDAVSTLISQHVDAVRAITREGVTKSTSPIGERLAEELEMVATHMVAVVHGAKLH
jgi:HPt (histidine-containing phosphotransfer) domain-containing protein